MKTLVAWTAALTLSLMCGVAFAQSPKTALPQGFTPVLQNAQVSVYHVQLRSGQKTNVHWLNEAVVVPLSSYSILAVGANHRIVRMERSAGKAIWWPGGMRSVTVESRPVDAVVVELNGAPSAAKASRTERAAKAMAKTK